MERTFPSVVSLENDYYQTATIDMYFEKENIWSKVNL